MLLGEAPGPNGDPECPLAGRPAARLAYWAGWVEDPSNCDLAREKLSERFELRNVSNVPAERNGKGTAWDRRAAAQMAEALKEDGLFDGRAAVLLGRRVTNALGLNMDFWDWWEAPGAWGLINVPHPSGIVRLYNDAEARERTGAVLRRAAGERA